MNFLRNDWVHRVGSILMVCGLLAFSYQEGMEVERVVRRGLLMLVFLVFLVFIWFPEEVENFCLGLKIIFLATLMCDEK